ncbi:integrase [Deinococcus sp. HSC-46F16]|uniref:tyrosine-type recombinase/integrase n=1 Tax=Deinococcus sp. HSC-46F16 TaxID=2910968 RepID=UPI00209DAB41|nr:site-specific integrase [Deinococcus sp. HSC-46F16]MCP2015934.1 integrase [Deinococcus sp. HSC-46F16]
MTKKRKKLPIGIRQLGSGHYQWRTVVNLPNGTRQRVTGTAATVTEASRQREQARVDAQRQLYTPSTDTTLDEYATRWLNAREALYSWSYVRGQRSMYQMHIKPALGARKLHTLTPYDIERLYLEARQQDERNPKRKGKELSTSMRKQLSTLTKMLLEDAVKHGLVARNPAEVIKPRHTRAMQERGRPKGTIPKAWTEEEASRFYAAARRNWLGRAFCFQLATGMRIGEVLGLRWGNVDLDTGIIRIEETLQSRNGHRAHGPVKTAESDRVIRVSGDALEILKEQRGQRRLAREAYPEQYVETDAVFVNTRGNFILPDTVYRPMTTLCERANVPYRGTHVLRHTYVTLQFRRRTDGRLISDQVGHTDPAFTQRVYRTVSPEERADLTLDLSIADKQHQQGPETGDGHEMGTAE